MMDSIASRVEQLWSVLMQSPNTYMDRGEESYKNPASD